MGLGLVARYYDRSEAFVVRSALEAAGVAVFMENYNQIALKPFSELALGGFRVLVIEEDLPAALAVLEEALANPAPCDQVLRTRHFTVAFLAFHAVQIFLVGLVLWVPMRTYRWEAA
ncbi:MAG: DUF2007 domain-containing protein [Hyphomonadaceae bacterium]|nr:DUF2007 domain-containing protein [Hyphomonadaceae bacterium]